MNVSYISKIEELNNERWEFRGKFFGLEFRRCPCQNSTYSLWLFQRNVINEHGNIEDIFIRKISMKNLEELKFYGLKIIVKKEN